ITAEELQEDKWQHFIDNLIESMRDANGAGLAAPQVYEPVRICAIEVKDNPRYPYKPNIALTLLVNPRITALDDESFESFEGCLSVPNQRGLLKRSVHIRVQALDRYGKELDFKVRGLSAGTYQHEVDHLNGILFVDRVEDPTTLTTIDNFEKYHKADFVERAVALVKRYGA
ncbi:peptide deformylase, partial [Myxococcota bacterium]|nr:peptide deformylase [Myxococcota bacterium]